MNFNLSKVGSIKGQSAIEYLITYGWMLLVVAVVGGAVFSMVQSENIESVSGFTGADVQVEDFGVTSQNELELVLRNGAADTVNINSVNVTDGDRYTYTTQDNSISVGDTEVVSLANVSEGDSAEALDLIINYDLGALENMQVSGTVSGSLELTEDASEQTNVDGEGSSEETEILMASVAGEEAHIWDIEGRSGSFSKSEYVYTGHSNRVNTITELSDGRVASGSDDNEVHIWTPEASEAVYTGHSSNVASLVELSDGRVASGSDDNEVHIWDPEGKSESFNDSQAIYTGHSSGVNSIIELSDGRIASASDSFTGGEVHIWDPEGKSESFSDNETVYDGHSGRIYQIAELSDGRIVSASGDNTAHVWDPDTDSVDTQYTEHGDYVTSITVLENGNIASASSDNTAHIWSPDSGSSDVQYTGHTGSVRSIVPLSSGRIASGEAGVAESEVHIWDPEGKSESFNGNDAVYTGHMSGAVDRVIELEN